jgi:hypothetical protein
LLGCGVDPGDVLLLARTGSNSRAETSEVVWIEFVREDKVDVFRRDARGLLDNLKNFVGVLLTCLSFIIVSDTLGSVSLATNSIQLSLCFGLRQLLHAEFMLDLPDTLIAL